MTSAKPSRRPKTPPAPPAPPAPAEPASTTALNKLDRVVALLRRPQGATLAELQDATGWQAHSVRGALAGAVKKRLATPVTSTKEERGRVYRTGTQVSA